ncbi:hypothetical protein U1Q18_003165 [Sarracenia purpurea var. burkii]
MEERSQLSRDPRFGMLIFSGRHRLAQSAQSPHVCTLWNTWFDCGDPVGIPIGLYPQKMETIKEVFSCNWCDHSLGGF